MKKYCSFLRGVNVKGAGMKMKEVARVFSNAGMSDISAVLASGNILFSTQKEKKKLKLLLQKVMSEYFDYETHLFIRDENETLHILNNNPFKKSDRLHVYTFVADGETTIEMLMREYGKTLPQQEEDAAVCNNVFYWQIPKGSTLKSGFGNILSRKDFKEKMTSRNINTIEKIVKKFKK